MSQHRGDPAVFLMRRKETRKIHIKYQVGAKEKERFARGKIAQVAQRPGRSERFSFHIIKKGKRKTRTVPQEIADRFGRLG